MAKIGIVGSKLNKNSKLEYSHRSLNGAYQLYSPLPHHACKTDNTGLKIILNIIMLSIMTTPLFFQIITEICQAWASMELSYEEQYQTSLPLLKCNEDLIEILEDHQVDV